MSEYGITVRWDKNFLTLLHLTLARRRGLKIYGGIRFGGTLSIEDAWTYGFDHVAMATGAGRPTVIDMKNNLIRGIRKASDFLMALQLTGAFKREALPNLQARVPAVVIGGGLTAIDTATELMAYYPLQVEKTLQRYDILAAEFGEARVRASYDAEELELLDEYLAHGRAVRAERARAEAAGEAPNFVPLVRAWGGVTIAYRKRLVDSPAYRLNHEEVTKALEEGVAFAENLNPIEAVPDERGAVKAMIFNREGQEAREGHDATVTLPARTVLVAAGHDAEHDVREGDRRHLSARREEEILPAARGVPRGRRPFSSEPGRERLLHVVRRRRPLREFLRRQPSALCRQRREGHGVGEGRLSARRQSLRGRTVLAGSIDPGRAGRGVGGARAAPRCRLQAPTSKTWCGSRRRSSK